MSNAISHWRNIAEIQKPLAVLFLNLEQLIFVKKSYFVTQLLKTKVKEIYWSVDDVRTFRNISE